MNIVCGNCFTTNRVPDDKNHTQATCGKCHQPVYQLSPVTLGEATFYPFIERNHLPVIVDFWASWCGPCQQMAPVFNRVAAQSPQLLFAKLNTKQATNIATAANIRSIPTLIFFHKGAEIDRISGGLNEVQLKQWLVTVLKKIS